MTLSGKLSYKYHPNNLFLAYETIFGASISFGSRKALATELGKEEKRDKLESIEKKAEQLKKLILQYKVCNRTLSKILILCF